MQPGNTVKLKSGGMVATVVSIDGPDCIVMYWNPTSMKFETARLPTLALARVD